MDSVHHELITAALGIAPAHLPAFAVALLTPPVGWLLLRVFPRTRFSQGWRQTGLCDRATVALLAVAGTVHLALAFGHADEAGMRAALLVNGLTYLIVVGAALWQSGHRSAPYGHEWHPRRAAQPVRFCRRTRGAAAVLLLVTISAYVAVIGSGREGGDQFGAAVVLLQLVALALILLPSAAARRGRRRWVGAGALVLALGVLSGAVLWGTALTAAETGGGGHGLPSPAEQAAADRLAHETRTSLARFTDEVAARAAGYQPALAGPDGLVHYENKAYQRDGRVLDPEAPEQLVYQNAEQGPLLLGAVYVMPRPGLPGPAVGGPLTEWHTHLVCISPAPPFLAGIPSPFGGCPALSVALTMPAMMHVWIVGDAYADKPEAGRNDKR